MALTPQSKFVDQYVDPVGKSVPRIEGRGIVTGQTKYAFDVYFPNMLVGKMLRSPHPHARIISIDTSKAEALPGVKSIVTAKDTHQIKFGSNEYFFPHTVDQMAIEADKVRYIGDEVAAVAAVDEETADEFEISFSFSPFSVLPAPCFLLPASLIFAITFVLAILASAICEATALCQIRRYSFFCSSVCPAVSLLK